MNVYKLESMTKGWFVGNFSPCVYTADYEIGVKRYLSGDKEQQHYHKLSTEFTLIVTGKILMNGVLFLDGDIIQVDPFESIKFECIEDAITVIFKTISDVGDKYITEQE